jgi:hypothetical protein
MNLHSQSHPEPIQPLMNLKSQELTLELAIVQMNSAIDGDRRFGRLDFRGNRRKSQKDGPWKVDEK